MGTSLEAILNDSEMSVKPVAIQLSIFNRASAIP